jgi:hypothetical protein
LARIKYVSTSSSHSQSSCQAKANFYVGIAQAVNCYGSGRSAL